MGAKGWRQIIDDFQARLESWGSGRRLKVDWPTWWVGPKNRSSRNILLLSGTTDLLLYVKVSSQEPGFWGLTRNRLRLLQVAPHKWFVVLLLGSSETGYLVPSAEVEHCTGSGVWGLATDGDFKINPSGLSEEFYFPSFDALIDSLERQMASPPALERA